MTAHTLSLFEEDYWLDAVAPGQWDAAMVKRDGQIIGRLPYVTQRRMGQLIIAKPWYTTWLGPWIEPSGGKYTSEISHQHQVLEELLKQLPKAAITDVFCAPEYSNMQAFAWAGYRLGMAYTHRITLFDDDSMWGELRDTVRRQIRKAEKQVAVHSHRSIIDMIAMVEKTFGRQGIDVENSFPVLERIDAAMAARGQRNIWTAEDAQGRIHAALYIAHDHRHAFYVAGGADPELRQSGAQALLMWHAIRAARAHAPIFDFCGSMVPGIEYFARGFGARQTPRYSAHKTRGLGSLRAAYLLARTANG